MLLLSVLSLLPLLLVLYVHIIYIYRIISKFMSILAGLFWCPAFPHFHQQPSDQCSQVAPPAGRPAQDAARNPLKPPDFIGQNHAATSRAPKQCYVMLCQWVCFLSIAYHSLPELPEIAAEARHDWPTVRPPAHPAAKDNQRRPWQYRAEALGSSPPKKIGF